MDDVARRIPVGDMLAVVGPVDGGDEQFDRAAGADRLAAHGKLDRRHDGDDAEGDRPIFARDERGRARVRRSNTSVRILPESATAEDDRANRATADAGSTGRQCKGMTSTFDRLRLTPVHGAGVVERQVRERVPRAAPHRSGSSATSSLQLNWNPQSSRLPQRRCLRGGKIVERLHRDFARRGPEAKRWPAPTRQAGARAS